MWSTNPSHCHLAFLPKRDQLLLAHHRPQHKEQQAGGKGVVYAFQDKSRETIPTKEEKKKTCSPYFCFRARSNGTGMCLWYYTHYQHGCINLFDRFSQCASPPFICLLRVCDVLWSQLWSIRSGSPLSLVLIAKRTSYIWYIYQNVQFQMAVFMLNKLRWKR